MMRTRIGIGDVMALLFWVGFSALGGVGCYHFWSTPVPVGP